MAAAVTFVHLTKGTLFESESQKPIIWLNFFVPGSKPIVLER
jgi:hypothetical protein